MSALELDSAEAAAMPGAMASTAPSTRQRTLVFAEAYGFVVLFVLIIAFFSLWPKTADTFATMANLRVILGGQVTVLIIAVGMVMPLLAGNIDLSVGAIAGGTSVVCAAAMSRFDQPLVVAIALGLLFAVTVGMLNGLLVAKVSANSFIITFGVATLLGGLLQWYTNALPITLNLPRAFQDFGNLTWFGIPRLVFALVPVLAAALFIQDRTPYGRYLQAIGSNARAAHLVGIRVSRNVFLSFVASALLASIGGILLTARSGGADPNAGPSFLFPAFTAVFLGMAMIRPGKPNVIGTVIAVYFLAVAVSGLTMAGADSWVRDVFNGAVLLIAISMATWFGKQQGVKRV